MESGSMFSDTPSDTAAPVEEILLSDSDEEELQPSFPLNRIFVPENGGEMIEEMEVEPTAELEERVYEEDLVVLDDVEKSHGSSGPAAEQNNSDQESILKDTLMNGLYEEASNGLPVSEPKTQLFNEETGPEGVSSSSEPPADILNPFFCDFEELNRQYYGVDESQVESPPEEKLNQVFPLTEREIAEAQLKQLESERRRPGPKSRAGPKQFKQKLADEIVADETAAEEEKTLVVSMKKCFVRVDHLTLDTLIKNGASQRTIDLFKIQNKANATIDLRNLPPQAKVVNYQKPLNFSNQSNVNGKSSKWSAPNLAERLKTLTDAALMAQKQLQSLNTNSNARPAMQKQLHFRTKLFYNRNRNVQPVLQKQSNIQTKLSHTIVSRPEKEAIPNTVSVISDTVKEKLNSFDEAPSSNVLKTKTKDLRVLIKDLKTEKIVRIGDNIKPVSEILSDICVIKAKTKDNFVPVTQTNVQAPVTSSPYFESSNTSESCMIGRNQSAQNGNQSSESLESKLSSFSTKPRLSVRKDLFAPEFSPSVTSPPIIPSPYFVSDRGNVESSGKSRSSVASSNIINSEPLSSLKMELKGKMLNNLKDKISNRLSSVLINPTTSNCHVPKSSGIIPNIVNDKLSQNVQFNGGIGLNDASAEQISAFTDQLLSFLPKTNTASNYNASEQKQPMTQSSSISASFFKNDQQKKSSESIKKNVQESFTMLSNSTSRSCKMSQSTESDIWSDSESISSCSSDTHQPTVLCEKTGQIIDSSESLPKNNQESLTQESSENISSESIKENGQESSTMQNKSPSGSSETSQQKEPGVMSNSESVSFRLSGSQQPVVLDERSEQVIYEAKSSPKSKQDQESMTPKTCGNVLSNSLLKSQVKQSMNHDSEAETRSKQHQRAAVSKDSQNTSSHEQEKQPVIQKNEMGASSAKSSVQKEVPICKNTNSRASLPNERKGSTTHKSMSSENDYSESPSTSSTLRSDNKLVVSSSVDDCEKQYPHKNPTGSKVSAKTDIEHQLLSRESPRISDQVVKKCSVVLEDCTKLITKKTLDRISSCSQPLPSIEDCESLMRNKSPTSKKITSPRSSEVESTVRPKSPEINKRSRSSEVQKEGRSRSPEVQKEGRSRSSEVQKEGRSRSPEVQKEGRSKSPEVQKEGRSKSPKLQQETRSVSPEAEATSSELSVVKTKKRLRSSEDEDECPKKKQKSDSPSSQQLAPVIFDLADERFPGFSVIEDILAVDGTIDIDLCHEDMTPKTRSIKTQAKNKVQGKRVIRSVLESCDGSMTFDKTVINNAPEKMKQRNKNSFRNLFTHLEMRLFDVGSIPFDGKILNEFHLDGNLDSETSDDESLVEKRARLKGKSELSKARSGKISKLTIKKQLSRSLPESSGGTKCSVILNDFALEKNLICVSAKKSSDSLRMDSVQEISEIKSSPNLKVFDERDKTDEKLTGRKPVIKVIRLNYDEVKDGISVVDLGRTLSATSRSTSVNRRKQGKPRKYGFNINNRNGGVKSPSKVISDLHFMVRNPKKRSK